MQPELKQVYLQRQGSFELIRRLLRRNLLAQLRRDFVSVVNNLQQHLLHNCMNVIQ